MDDLEICNRIYSILHMHHIRILKGSADVEDAIHSRYVGQEGIPQALSFRCAPAAQQHLSCAPTVILWSLGAASRDTLACVSHDRCILLQPVCIGQQQLHSCKRHVAFRVNGRVHMAEGLFEVIG